MEKLLVISLRATELTSSLFQCNSKEGKEEVDPTIDEIVRCLNECLETVPGRKFINLVKGYARIVVSKEAFMNAVKEFFHGAKKWATSPMRMFCLFVLGIAALITYIICVPESVVAEWVTSLLAMLADRLSFVGLTICDKIGEFFAGNSLELPAVAAN